MPRSSPGRPGPPPFAFVVGCGRSGTTLLRAMLDSHPDLAVPDEVSFIVRFSYRRHALRYGWPARFDGDRFGAMLQTNTSFRRWGLERQDVRRVLADPPVTTFPDAVRRLYAHWAERQGKARYADKTPMHVLYMRRLLRLFPEARFIHLIRDGRDVATSYLDAQWGPSSLDEAAFDWRRRVRAGRATGRRLGPARYLEVRYEGLVGDPEAVARAVCRFVDLPYDDKVLRYYEHADRVIAATKFGDAHQHLRLPPTAGLRDWRRDMATDDRCRFEHIAGPLLAELGYETAAMPRRRDRVRVASQAALRAVRRGSEQAVTGLRVRRRPGTITSPGGQVAEATRALSVSDGDVI